MGYLLQYMRSTKSETVLVVDDHPYVLEVFAESLRDLGYSVLEAGGPRQAQRLARGPVTIDLLLTDFHMPEMNGVQLAYWFHLHFPHTKLLLVSGSPCEVEPYLSGPLGFALLDKAHAFDRLAGVVRGLLAGCAPAARPRPAPPARQARRASLHATAQAAARASRFPQAPLAFDPADADETHQANGATLTSQTAQLPSRSGPWRRPSPFLDD